MSSRPNKIYLLTIGEYDDWTVDSFVYTREEAEYIIEKNRQHNEMVGRFRARVDEIASSLGVIYPEDCYHKYRHESCKFSQPKPVPPPPGVSQKEYMTLITAWKENHEEHHSHELNKYNSKMAEIRAQVCTEMNLETIPNYKTIYDIVELEEHHSSTSYGYSGRDAAWDKEKKHEEKLLGEIE